VLLAAIGAERSHVASFGSMRGRNIAKMKKVSTGLYKPKVIFSYIWVNLFIIMPQVFNDHFEYY
jgi:hypothetical protein